VACRRETPHLVGIGPWHGDERGRELTGRLRTVLLEGLPRRPRVADPEARLTVGRVAAARQRATRREVGHDPEVLDGEVDRDRAGGRGTSVVERPRRRHGHRVRGKPEREGGGEADADGDGSCEQATSGGHGGPDHLVWTIPSMLPGDGVIRRSNAEWRVAESRLPRAVGPRSPAR
jgi:hypothetical protein